MTRRAARPSLDRIERRRADPRCGSTGSPRRGLAAAVRRGRARLAAGADLPLAGRTFAVKDNIDVAGVPTTAGCPAFAYGAGRDGAGGAGACVDAGAVFVGKTNLDQFATGLVGTRSPYGAVRNAVDPDRVSGGSSTGSAVAVALGLVDFALGTDTAGSGRVPAAFNGIVGIKPTRGLVSHRGVVPACASFDCVSVFARSLDLAERVLAVLAGPGPTPAAVPAARPTLRRVALRPRRWPAGRPVVAWVDPGALADVDPGYRAALRAGRRATRGRRLRRRSPSTSARSSRRAVSSTRAGSWPSATPRSAPGSTPTRTTSTRWSGRSSPRPGTCRPPGWPPTRTASGTWPRRWPTCWAPSGPARSLLPTVPFHPTLADVAADPVGVNARLGSFTTFVNLLDLCAVAVPSDPVDGLPCGVSLIGPAWSDRVQADLARLAGSPGRDRRPRRPAPERRAGPGSPSRRWRWPWPAPTCPASRSTTSSPTGGRGWSRTTTTAPVYRLLALATEPPKPGLVRVADGADGGAVEVEVWELPPAGFAGFVAALPRPMAVGQVTLADGTSVPGFLCEPEAVDGAADITATGGWRAYLAGR